MGPVSGVRRVALVVLMCAVPRALGWWLFGSPGGEAYHWQLSDGLLASGTLLYEGVPTAAFEPLFPILIALVRLFVDSVSAVVVVQIVLSCVSAVLMDRLATRVSGSARAGLVAAALFSVYPYFVRQSVGMLELPLFLTLMVAAWLAWTNDRPTVAVSMLALATLTRAFVASLIIAALVLLALRRPRAAARAAVAAMLLLAPWMAHNYSVSGRLWPTRHEQLLFASNNPHTVHMVPRHDMDLFLYASEGVLASVQGLPEPVPNLDREYARAVTDWWRAHPLQAAWVKLRSAAYLFVPRMIPYEPADQGSALVIEDAGVRTVMPRTRPLPQEMAHGGAAAVVLVMGLIGWWGRRHLWRRDVLLLATFVVVIVTAGVYFPTTRLRATIDPILMVYAACAVARYNITR
jgi:ABC-type multidrug transport system fused ATPase/permease subunit